MNKKKCLEHGGYDNDGDGKCHIYELAKNKVKKTLNECRYE